jgi:hypothetical protein
MPTDLRDVRASICNARAVKHAQLNSGFGAIAHAFARAPARTELQIRKKVRGC